MSKWQKFRKLYTFIIHVLADILYEELHLRNRRPEYDQKDILTFKKQLPLMYCSILEDYNDAIMKCKYLSDYQKDSLVLPEAENTEAKNINIAMHIKISWLLYGGRYHLFMQEKNWTGVISLKLGIMFLIFLWKSLNGL